MNRDSREWQKKKKKIVFLTNSTIKEKSFV
jgi:ribonucleotide monophosphatase NagD (HAD superfamily)